MPNAIVLANLLVTGYLTGLIWCVQIVHYPLFAEVGQAAFPRYHLRHTSRITAIVATPMLAELLLSPALIAAHPDAFPSPLAWACTALSLLTWICTAALAVPLHGLLGTGYDARAIDRLVATNWIRTLAWSCRLALLAWGTWAVLGA